MNTSLYGAQWHIISILIRLIRLDARAVRRTSRAHQEAGAAPTAKGINTGDEEAGKTRFHF